MAVPVANENVLQLLSTFKSLEQSRQIAESVEELNKISVDLARDATTRRLVGQSIPSIWLELAELWKRISTHDFPPSEGGLILAVARFTRNIVTADPSNQSCAFKCEPYIRTIIHNYTSYANIQEPKTFIITRFLMQTLSNIVTSNVPLIQDIWGIYMTIPEDQNILLRVLVHPDDRVVLAAVVFIANCTADSSARMRLLLSTPSGVRVCIRLLDELSRRVETEEDSDAGEVFDVGWSIFRNLASVGLGPQLFSAMSMEGVIITPHQTAFLKVLDSYLLQLSRPTSGLGTTALKEEQLDALCSLFISKFFELSSYSRSSIRHSLGPVGKGTGAEPVNATDATIPRDTAALLQDLDILLPKVCEALVLITQCFCTMTLAQDGPSEVSAQSKRTRVALSKASSEQGSGFVEDIIDLLRLLDTFLPRIVLGRASWSTPRPGVTPSLPPDAQANVKGFNYLKRDLVRLLGILCYDSRAVQDQVRECNGIPVVMNLCVTDELNPYLREHALFALRNLLHGNAENQAVVDAIKPMGTWDENGILRDTPGTRK